MHVPFKRIVPMLVSVALAAGLVPAIALGAESPSAQGTDAPVSATDASTREGLGGYSAVVGPDAGAAVAGTSESPEANGGDGLDAYSFGATRKTFNDVIRYAERYEGMPYVWGGKDPVRDGGFDCSGYVCWVYNEVCGTSIDSDGTNAARLYTFCTPISREEALPGDIVFFRGTYGSINYISHVGIYCGGGVMIDAGNPIGYDNVDAVRNMRGARAAQVYGRLVDLGRTRIALDAPGVSVCVANQVYAGVPVTPEVSVFALGARLAEGVDYTLAFEDNARPGEARVVVTGIGECAGTSRTQSFQIHEQVALSGNHALHMAHDGGYMLDITGASTAEGAYAALWEWTGSGAQGFTFERQASGHYIIRNEHSGLCLSVKATPATIGNDARIVQQAWRGETTQLWDIRDVGGAYVITSVADGRMALDVQNAASKNGSRIQLFDFNGGRAQLWATRPFVTMRERLDERASRNAGVLADGLYTVRIAVHPNFMLDCFGAGTANGTPMELFERNASVAQVFRVVHDEKGYVTLVNPHSGLAVDVDGCRIANGTKVQLWERNPSGAQKWIAEPHGAGIRLVSHLDEGKALDLCAIDLRNFAKVQLWEVNGSAAQDWVFERIG